MVLINVFYLHRCLTDSGCQELADDQEQTFCGCASALNFF